MRAWKFWINKKSNPVKVEIDVKRQERLLHECLFGFQMKNCASHWSIILRVQLRTMLHDDCNVGVTTMINEYKCPDGRQSAHTLKPRPSEVTDRSNHRNYKQRKRFGYFSGEFMPEKEKGTGSVPFTPFSIKKKIWLI